jgi:lauroyl/myristoyl acyltransferase
VLMKALRVPLTVVAMPEPDPNVNSIRHRVRAELQADTIEVRQSLDTPLQIRRRLAEGRTVAMLMDRHVDRDRVPVTMFGRRAHFLGAPALLAYLTGAPLVPIFLVREGRGRFRARPQEPIVVDRTGNREEQVQRAAQRVATLLEREIEARPDCWYQFYKYWEEPESTRDIAEAGGSSAQAGREGPQHERTRLVPDLPRAHGPGPKAGENR